MGNKLSDNLFRVIAEESPNMVFINKGGRIVYANKRCEEIMGYSREEFYSEDFDFIALIAPEFRDLVRENFKIHMSGKDIPPYEYKLITKDGREISAIHYTKLIEYEGKRAIIGIVSDITAQKALIESEAKFKSLVEYSLAGVYLIQDGVFKYVNPKLAEIFGYTQDELIGKKGPRDLTYPDDWYIVKENLRKRFEGEVQFINYSFRGQKKNGEVFDIEVFGSRIIYKGRPAVVGTLMDITERKRHTEEIQRQHDIQKVLSNLLQLSLEDISFEEILDRALEQILSLPRLTFQQRGAIFLVEDETETLMMKAQRGITKPMKKVCSRVKFGNCLCGLAAVTKEIQFTDCLDESHSTQYEGITPHGHYCVPILYGNKISGVINIYLEEGHKQLQIEIDFLTAVANTLSGIIQRKRSERAVLESEAKLRTVFNGSADVIMIVSPGGEIKSANRTAFRTLGYFEDTLIGKPFSILLNPSTSLTFDDLTREVRMQKTVLESVEFLRADGSICPMDMTVNLVPWDKGMMVLVNLRDVTERVIAEKAVRRREAILESVRFAAEEFLKTGSWEKNINEILKLIGMADDVSRVYLFKKHISEDGKLLCSQLFEWVAEDIEPQIDNPELQNFLWEVKGSSRFNRMQKGEPVYGNVSDLPESEQELFKSQDIKSILAMPIFVNNELWGFIGFDECRYEREWSGVEIDALRAAADIIGVAISRGEIEESLKQRINELERFSRATIQREFRMKELKEEIERLRGEIKRLKG